MRFDEKQARRKKAAIGKSTRIRFSRDISEFDSIAAYLVSIFFLSSLNWVRSSVCVQ